MFLVLARMCCSSGVTAEWNKQIPGDRQLQADSSLLMEYVVRQPLTTARTEVAFNSFKILWTGLRLIASKHKTATGSVPIEMYLLMGISTV